MKNAEISLYLATNKHAPGISVRVFTEALNATDTILRTLDDALFDGQFEWYFSALGLGSGHATLMASRAERRSGVIRTESIIASAQTIAERFVEGLAQLERSAEWPDVFTHEALAAARRLVAIREDGIVDIVVSTEGVGPFSLSLQVDRHVQEILGQMYSVLGSIEGVIESIRLTSTLQFALRERVSGLRILCSSDESLLPQMRQAIGRQAIVSGQLSYTEHGRLVSVSGVDTVTLSDSRSTTPLDTILGVAPDFTDGLAVDQFVDWIHNDAEP